VKWKGKQAGAMIVHLSIESARVVPPEIVIFDALSVQRPKHLIARKNKSQLFRATQHFDYGGSKKPIVNARRIFRGLGRRPPSAPLCRTSRRSEFG
jgi:hypothetical protein